MNLQDELINSIHAVFLCYIRSLEVGVFQKPRVSVSDDSEKNNFQGNCPQNHWWPNNLPSIVELQQCDLLLQKFGKHLPPWCRYAQEFARPQVVYNRPGSRILPHVTPRKVHVHFDQVRCLVNLLGQTDLLVL